MVHDSGIRTARGSHRSSCLVTAVLVAASLSAQESFAASSLQQEQADRYLFENVTVLSPTSGEASPGAWVGVEDGRFTLIAGEEPAGWSGARRIPGHGLFLVPGLIDMHVHPGGREDLEALVVHGVTTARLGRGTPTHLRWREAVRSGAIKGPNLVVGSPYVWDRGPDGFGVDTPDEETVRRHVRRFQKEGYDFVKIVDVYDHGLAEALFDEATRVDIPVFGHVADDESVPFDWEWTAGLGYRTLEHLDEVVRLALPSSAAERDLEDFVDTARRHGVAFTSLFGPMLARARAYARAAEGLPAYTSEDEARAFVVSGGNGSSQLRSRTKSLGERSTDDLRAAMPDTVLVMKVFTELFKAGVPILPGTEGSSLTKWAGATLHDELAVFTRGGMAPIDVLRAATVEAAGRLGVEGVLGEIREGAIADAMLVSDDPRDGLRALRAPLGVMVRGRWYGSDELASMRRLFGIEHDATR